MQKKIIVVFGGSFNPPIHSHFSLAQQVINEYENIEKIVFIPVNQKYNKEGLIDNEHRYNMLKLVCDRNPNFIVSRIEIDSDRQLYTIETLEKIQEEYRNYEIWFSCGTDNLRTFNTWKRPEELFGKYKILIHEREPDVMEDIIENDVLLKKYADRFIKVEKNIKSNLSSTFVRDKIKRGKSIEYLAPDEICDYIEKNKLYYM